ncbi:hypothetical protein JW930_07555 [Candidatus Woesearchaeota archaeon]|nr:hypothetical protein [Candidatus Woesearchaeota archaeon]
MAIFSKKKKKKISKEEKIIEILRRTAKIKSELEQKDSTKLFNKFVRVLRKSISKLFNIHYEFTYEELSEDIKRKRIPKELKEKICALAEKLIEIQYTTSDIIGKDTLTSLILDFEDIVRHSKFKLEKPSKKFVEKVPLINKIIRSKEKPSTEQLLKKLSIQPSPQKIEPASMHIPPVEMPEAPKPGETIQDAPTIPIPANIPTLESPSPEKNAQLNAVKELTPPEVKEPMPLPDKENADSHKPLQTLELEPLPAFENKMEEKEIPEGLSDTFPIADTPKDIKRKVKHVVDYKEKEAQVSEDKIPDIKKIEVEESIVKKRLESLPEFKISKEDQELIDKRKKVHTQKEKLKDTLTDLISKVTGEKKEILEEEEKLRAKSHELEDQKTRIDLLEERLKLSKKKTKLPVLKKFKVAILDDQVEIEDRQRVLHERDKELTIKFDELKTVQDEINKTYIKVNEKEKSLLEKEGRLLEKEQLVQLIKKELEEESKRIMRELEGFKKELSEKHDAFIKLRDYFRKRENKLSVEESNLLNEKRTYVRFLEANMDKHKELLEKDIINTEEQIQNKRLRGMEIEEEIKKMLEAQSQLASEIEKVEEEAKSKRIYFERTEKGFLEKDPLFENIRLEIEKKELSLLEKEKKIEAIGKELELLKTNLEKREQSIEAREFEAMAHEKELDTIRIKIEGKKAALKLKEYELNRRIDNFKDLQEEVNRSIREKRDEIKEVHNKLWRMHERLGLLGAEDKELKTDLEQVQGDIAEYDTIFDDDLMPGEPGTPVFLEILRLVSIAKKAIREDELDEARNMYGEISSLYKKLPDHEMEEAYKHITTVFQPKESALPPQSVKQTWDYSQLLERDNSNIDILMAQFEHHVSKGDLSASNRVYNRLQDAYNNLSDSQREVYYPRIIQLYNQVLATNSA